MRADSHNSFFELRVVSHMPRGHGEGRCGRNKSSLRLDWCQGTAEWIPLCLTLKVFDLQQGDPAAGSSKNTSPRHVRLWSPLCAARLSAHYCEVTRTHTHLLLHLWQPAAQNVKSEDPRGDLRALGGQAAPTGKPIPIWGNQQDRCFRAQLVVAQVHVCVCAYIHTHTDTWQLNLRFLHCEGYVLFSCFCDLAWC